MMTAGHPPVIFNTRMISVQYRLYSITAALFKDN